MIYRTAILFLIPFIAQAATLTWVAPTERENGDKLNLAEIQGYEFTSWKDGAKYETKILGNVTTYDFNYPTGKYQIYLKTMTKDGLKANCFLLWLHLNAILNE